MEFHLMTNHLVHSDTFLNTISETAVVKKLATGFAFVEGPIWDRRQDHLIFSDIAGDRMHRWSDSEGIGVYRDPSNMANGNAFDSMGRLVTCEHATSRLVRDEGSDGLMILASHYNGKELNSPNDVVVKSDQSIYFTDPDSGRKEFWGIPRERELDFCGVYRLSPDGDLVLLVDDFEIPNGLCFSLDESSLFINDTRRRHIRRFSVEDDGSISGGEVWAEVPGKEGERPPDGMKIDSSGTLFCTGPGGIHVFDSDGQLLGVIVFDENVANFAWGGSDLKTLYVTAATSLYSVQVEVAGLPAF
jgi:gluconolactonase